KAKKLKRKIQGAEEALEKSLGKLKKIEKDIAKEEKEKEELKSKVIRKKEWYEKFRWFRSSEGFLVIGGRDATTNEIVVKKHMDTDDVVFHTDMAGSPFFIVKSEGKKIGDATLQETAQATAVYSKAWKVGLGTTDVFHVKPEQVTKEAQSGEYMAKGSFMVRGKTTYIRPDMSMAIGIKDDQIIGGPIDAVKANSNKHVIIIQGKGKSSAIAKKIVKKLGGGDLDEIIRFLPPGGCELKK
ncbi:NFACT RNA binding domain-containing protein, partial [Nanoarchaeota archaeon]